MKFTLQPNGTVTIDLALGDAAMLYSELCNTDEIDNECPGDFNCADYCKNDHGTQPVLYLTPSIVALQQGLEGLFPNEEDESP